MYAFFIIYFRKFLLNHVIFLINTGFNNNVLTIAMY